MKWLLATSTIFLFPLFVLAQSSNAGIVQGLWFDAEPVFVGETTRIYVAIRNNTGGDLTGRVEFFDNGDLIERTEVSALNNRIIETWADWTPTFGEHTITANLSRTEINQIGTGTEAVAVISALAERKVLVDYDTDGDGIGNQTDTDDDNDGVSDEDEAARGTDPLDPADPAPEPEQTKTSTSTSEAGTPTEEVTDETERNGDEPDGLEQYLADSRADAALEDFTDYINEAHRRIDAYRASRNQRDSDAAGSGATDRPAEDAVTDSQSESATASSSTTTSSSTITILETDPESNQTQPEITRSQSEPRESWLAKLARYFFLTLDHLYTFILFIASLYLSHPIIVQLSLLFLILFILLKIAKRLGRRPQG